MRSSPTAALLALAAAAGLAHATISLNSTLELAGEFYWNAIILPSAPLTAACTAAWAAPIPCSDWLLRFQGAAGSVPESEVFTLPVLSELCAAECLAGLESWRDSLRDACSDEDAAAASTVDLTRSTAAAAQWEGSERGQFFLGSFLNESMYMVEYLYYAGCLKDLPTDTFCYLLPSDDPFIGGPSEDITNTTSPTSDVAKQYCNSTCSTQQNLWLLDIVGPTVGEADFTNEVNATTLCPGLDTSKYPFLAEINGGNTTTTGSSGNGSGSGSGSGSGGVSAGGNSSEEGAAAMVRGGGALVWGVAVVVGAVAAGFSGL
ncbi:hypothetical protein DFP73DRAFT_155017 [Morchella snyderi]|nr:hypothetical protein DFP73DRAFT_155017 [Morchella snyderi]